MKKHQILILLFFVFPLLISAQSIRGGLIGGMNISQVDGDEEYGYNKYGLNVGALAIVPFTSKFSASIETIYNQKGSNQSPIYTDSLNGEYKLILNYVEVPVLFYFTDKEIVKFGTGFSWGKLMQFKEWQDSQRINWTTTYGPYKRSDWDILVDAQVRIFKGLNFDFRYSYSLAKIRTKVFTNVYGQSWTRKQYNNMLTFRLIYVFKDAPMPNKKNKNNNKTK